jgi:hypothetical protein
MSQRTILIIRHAEKPDADDAMGVDADGTLDKNSLTPRGWQRAGAWVQLFVPALGQKPLLPRPTTLFASAAVHHSGGDPGSKSRRPLETITPLSATLEIDVDLRFVKGDEPLLAKAISKIDGVVLVCWQHENIAAIAAALAPISSPVPQHWPGHRFNVIYQFSRSDGDAVWAFQQVVPVLLDGDEAKPIALNE